MHHPKDPRPQIAGVTTTRRIRALLELRGWSMVQLSQRLGTSQRELARRLTLREPFSGRCSLRRIATELQVPLATLVTGKPWPDVTR